MELMICGGGDAQDRAAAERPDADIKHCPDSVPSSHPASQNPPTPTHLKASAQEKTTWAWPGLRLIGKRASISLQGGRRGSRRYGEAEQSLDCTTSWNNAQGWRGNTKLGAVPTAGSAGAADAGELT
jgi:hypothetical protein